MTDFKAGHDAAAAAKTNDDSEVDGEDANDVLTMVAKATTERHVACAQCDEKYFQARQNAMAAAKQEPKNPNLPHIERNLRDNLARVFRSHTCFRGALYELIGMWARSVSNVHFMDSIREDEDQAVIALTAENNKLLKKLASAQIANVVELQTQIKALQALVDDFKKTQQSNVDLDACFNWEKLEKVMRARSAGIYRGRGNFRGRRGDRGRRPFDQEE